MSILELFNAYRQVAAKSEVKSISRRNSDYWLVSGTSWKWIPKYWTVHSWSLTAQTY